MSDKSRVADLGDVCNVRRGAVITRKDTADGEVPVIAGGLSPAYFHNEANRPTGTITVSGSGANAGAVAIWDTPIWASDCSTIEPLTGELDGRYLYLHLKAMEDYIMRELRQGAAQPHVYPKDLAKLRIQIPPIDEQKRIVAKLDQALGYVDRNIELEVKKARDAKTCCDVAFSKVLRENGSEWPSVKIGESCDYENGKAHEQFVSDIGEYRLVTSKFISTEGLQARTVTTCLSPLQAGDVAFVLSDLPNGKALSKAYLVGEGEKLALNQRVMRLRSNRFAPEFLYLQINRHPELLAYDNGEGQTHLKLKQILDCTIFCPDLATQVKVAERLLLLRRTCNDYLQCCQQKILELNSLRNKLLSAAFAGDF